MIQQYSLYSIKQYNLKKYNFSFVGIKESYRLHSKLCELLEDISKHYQYRLLICYMYWYKNILSKCFIICLGRKYDIITNESQQELQYSALLFTVIPFITICEISYFSVKEVSIKLYLYPTYLQLHDMNKKIFT